MWEWLQYIFSNRKVVVIAFLSNLIGSIYGFYWYKEQLASTPIYFWLFVPDSPLSSSLFTFVLALWLWRKKVSPLLVLIAFVCCLKYGIWCVVVLGIYGVRDGGMVAENWMLVASHAAMAAEVLIYSFLFKFQSKYLWLGATWLLVNDFMDYVYGVHPYLEDDGLLGNVKIFTLCWSVCTIGIAYWVCRRNEPSIDLNKGT
jgi:uncharacterized membrane protein YpjA